METLRQLHTKSLKKIKLSRDSNRTITIIEVFFCERGERPDVTFVHLE